MDEDGAIPIDVVFEAATTEMPIDLYALGAEAMLLAYRRQLISRIGVWPATLAEIEAEVTQEVLG